MKRILLILFLASLIISSCTDSSKDLTGDDMRLFKGSAWELAKAVESQDTSQIKAVLLQHKISVNYQEPKFGETLLEWAVWTDRPYASKVLLECGANPNLPDTYDGNYPLSYAAGKFETSDYVRLLLKYKANPNSLAKNDTNNMLCTPLISAAYHRIESVKLLVDAGADINYLTKSYRCALGTAFIFKKIDIVRYLIIEKGAKFDRSFGKTVDGDNILITNLLRSCVFPLNSEQYKIKMQVVDFLKAKGMDYWKTPIPPHYYRNYSKDFLSKY